MTSNPPSSLQNQQRLHRRQNSIPVTFEATKVQMPPTIQRQMLHRRGQSFDVSRASIRRQQYSGSAVSMHTNIGPIQGQQILREAQQQRTARPGQQQLQPRLNTSAAQQCGFGSTTQQIDMSYDFANDGNMSSPGMMPQSYQNIQFPMQADSMNSFMLDENNPNYFQMFHNMSHLEQAMPVSDRRMSQPDLRIQTGLRPYTPTQQLQTAHFPLTPVHTPLQQQAVPHRQMQDSPQWHEQETTIISPRPISMQKSRSLQGIAEHQELNSFNDILDAPELSAVTKSFSSAEPTKTRQHTHSKSTSMVSNDEIKPLFGEVTDTNLRPTSANRLRLSPDKAPSSPSRPALSPRRMSISDLNLEPGISASIEETNITLDDIAHYIEGPDPGDNKWICKYEENGKICDKRFGRKENIKSHVQTHLGDRQFKCNHCDKCFVRGHDLKRHAKIHTGSKAYACLCGNAFARHDALTRHRQRGMCIGAFEGVVRKEVKRGRPKKHRPDMDERVDKASRTRHKKQLSSSSFTNGIDVYTSSASSCSLSSWGSPPADTMDNLSIHEPSASSPMMKYEENMDMFGMNNQHVDMMSQPTLHPNVFSFTPPASPGYSTGNKPSPSYRELTPEDFATFTRDVDIAMVTEQPIITLSPRSVHNTIQLSPRRLDESKISNQAMSMMNNDQFDLPSMTEAQQNLMSATQTTSLPSLSHSSSPPPQEPTSAMAFDFPDDNPLRMSTMSQMSFGLSALKQGFEVSGDDSQRNEFDSFLDYNDESQMSLGLGLSTSNNDSFFDSL